MDDHSNQKKREADEDGREPTSFPNRCKTSTRVALEKRQRSIGLSRKIYALMS